MTTFQLIALLLTDNLGSVVAVVNASGGLVSRQAYYPYGGVRSDVGTISTTDFGYTAQRNLDAQGNNYRLGLMDYQARFYDAYLHHFIQPDSIVSDGNPQSLNRYSYGLNNPSRYTDPTGHKGCDEIDKNGQCVNKQLTTGNESLINFSAENGQSWSDDEKKILESKYETVARRLAQMMSGGGFYVSPHDAYYLIFSGPTTILKKNSTCAQNHGNDPSYTCDAENRGNNTEWIYSNAKSAAFTTTHLLVHELGHNFFSNNPNDVDDNLLRTQAANGIISHIDFSGPLPTYYGYYSDSWEYGYSWDNRAGEELADMFVAWTYGVWENSTLGTDKSSFMQGTMKKLL